MSTTKVADGLAGNGNLRIHREHRAFFMLRNLASLRKPGCTLAIEVERGDEERADHAATRTVTSPAG
jgi:hypothetical protein